METAGPERKTGRQAEKDYRQRRSDILRRLGQSAFLNGSQFAILWVNPSTSQTDVFASEALQPKLQQWLDDKVRAEARTLSRRLRDERAEKLRRGQEVLEPSAVFDVDGQVPASAINDERLKTDADDVVPVFALGGAQEKPQPVESSQPSSPRPPVAFASTPSVLQQPYAAIFPVDGNFVHPQPPASPTAPRPQPSPRTLAARSPSNAPSPNDAFPTNRVIDASWVRHTFAPDELAQWYSERFAELWQKTEKIVCKAWIKVIQPAKHTKFQYQKGEETRPDWWPRDVRHKEPDHLSKAGAAEFAVLDDARTCTDVQVALTERVALLVHLLHTAPVSIEDLEMGSASVSAHIPPERMEILREIYRIAKEERRAKQELPGVSSRVSSLPPADGGLLHRRYPHLPHCRPP